MATITSEPEERVNHPKWYTSHKSGIECIELIEHLPANLANATKYVWRCGLKTTETPLRDLQSARWYVRREEERVDLFDLEDDDPMAQFSRGLRGVKTDIVWRTAAKRVIRVDDGLLSEFLAALLANDFDAMLDALDNAIQELEAPAP